MQREQQLHISQGRGMFNMVYVWKGWSPTNQPFFPLTLKVSGQNFLRKLNPGERNLGL